MRNTSTILSMVAVVAAVAVSIPASAQVAGVTGEQVAQAANAAAGVNQLPPALRAAILSGNSQAVVQALQTLRYPVNNPQALQALATALGQVSGQRGAQSSPMISGVIGYASTVTGGANVGVLQSFSGALSAAVIQSGGGLAGVQAATAAMVQGAGKDEATVGLVARAVSSGVVSSLVQAQIPATAIAGVVQAGVTQGAATIVGPNVIVRVDTTEEKPVSDVTLVLNGTELNKGTEVVFVSIENTGETNRNPIQDPGRQDDVSPS